MLLGSGDEVEELGMNEQSWAWEGGRVGGVGQQVSVFAFVSHHPALLLSGNKLNWFSLSSLFCPWWHLLSEFHVFILTHKFLCLIFPACPVDEEEWEGTSVGILQPAKDHSPQQETLSRSRDFFS